MKKARIKADLEDSEVNASQFTVHEQRWIESLKKRLAHVPPGIRLVYDSNAGGIYPLTQILVSKKGSQGRGLQEVWRHDEEH